MDWCNKQEGRASPSPHLLEGLLADDMPRLAQHHKSEAPVEGRPRDRAHKGSIVAGLEAASICHAPAGCAVGLQYEVDQVLQAGDVRQGGWQGLGEQRLDDCIFVVQAAQLICHHWGLEHLA